MIQQDKNSSYDPQIEIDGCFVYKASAVNCLFSSNPLSRDRLRRVRGFTKFTTDETENALAIETAVMAGDPILVNLKGTLKVS